VLVAVLLVSCGNGEEEAPAEAVVTRDAQLLATVETGSEWIAAIGDDAQARATSPAARSYAAILATDHHAVGREVASRAQQQGEEPAASDVTTELANEAQTARAALQQMDGAEFDVAFVEHSIRLQQRLLAAIARDVNSARSSEVQQLANDARPMLDAHILRGRQLLSELRLAQAREAAALPAPAAAQPAEAAPSGVPAERANPPAATPPEPAPDTAAPAPPDTSSVAPVPTGLLTAGVGTGG
jgi:predicted outer membrane protein